MGETGKLLSVGSPSGEKPGLFLESPMLLVSKGRGWSGKEKVFSGYSMHFKQPTNELWSTAETLTQTPLLCLLSPCHAVF